MNLYQRICIIALSLACLLFTLGVTSVMSANPKGDVRPTMRSIFKALTTVFPLSLTEETFENPTNRQQIQSGLRTIAQNAAKLASHGNSVPPGFDFLQRSLSRDAQESVTLFESGYHEESRFVFQQLIDNCFLCHSQLPSSQSFGLGQHFLDQLDMQHLGPREQVRLAVATRQFDTALTACEALFQSASTPADQIDVMAFFEDYLRIVIRVHHDFPRAVKTLEAFQNRPDVPRYLKAHITAWVADLKSLQHDKIKGDGLAHAQGLMQVGQARNRFLADRRGLIYFVVASSLLHRYVSNGPTTPLERAQAYYLLGVADSYIPRSSWISETEYFLEQAIRMAPKSAVAKSAYSFLEEYITMGLTGSISTDFPSSIQLQMSELRQLIEGS